MTSTTTAPSVRLSFIKFVVRDLGRMLAFYEGALGLTLSQTIESEAMTEKVMRGSGPAETMSLVLYSHKDGREITVGDGHGPLGCFVRDVEAAMAHAISLGATLDREPFETGTMRVGFVRDPEGRQIEFLSMIR